MCPPLALTAADGGMDEASRVTYASAPGAPPAVLSGGVPLAASQLAPVTDGSIVAQIQPAALPFVRQVALSTLGLPDYGVLQCKPCRGTHPPCLSPVSLV